MNLSKIKEIFFLTKEEKEPCPKCKKNTMQYNPGGSSGFDLACIFTCESCKESKQHLTCCTFWHETVREKRKNLIKYGIFQLLNGRNPEYKFPAP